MENRERIQEVAPKAGLVFSERGMITGVMCKPKIMPVKSMTLEQIEEMEKKIIEQYNNIRKNK